jgi:hypothetical protein
MVEMRELERTLLLCASVAMLGGLLFSASTTAASADHSPRVILLDYGEAAGDVGPDRNLDAFARGTNALRFSISYNGHHAAAPGRYHRDVTNTTLHGRAKHPWKPNRKQGGQRVIRLVHQALFDRGWVRVKLRARAHGSARSFRVRIDRSTDCVSDPPQYPISCQVKVD